VIAVAAPLRGTHCGGPHLHLLFAGAFPDAELVRVRRARTVAGPMQLRLAGFTFDEHLPCAVTPLHAACIAGNVALVELLLRHGARPECVSVSGTTPIECAGILRSPVADEVERLLCGV
jgi:hypothetical protein